MCHHPDLGAQAIAQRPLLDAYVHAFVAKRTRLRKVEAGWLTPLQMQPCMPGQWPHMPMHACTHTAQAVTMRGCSILLPGM